jgi:hypothetical protein
MRRPRRARAMRRLYIPSNSYQADELIKLPDVNNAALNPSGNSRDCEGERICRSFGITAFMMTAASHSANMSRPQTSTQQSSTPMRLPVRVRMARFPTWRSGPARKGFMQVGVNRMMSAGIPALPSSAMRAPCVRSPHDSRTDPRGLVQHKCAIVATGRFLPRFRACAGATLQFRCEPCGASPSGKPCPEACSRVEPPRGSKCAARLRCRTGRSG